MALGRPMPRPWSRGVARKPPALSLPRAGGSLAPPRLGPRRPDASFASRPTGQRRAVRRASPRWVGACVCFGSSHAIANGNRKTPARTSGIRSRSMSARYPYDAYSSHGAARSTQREPPDRAGRYAPHAGLVEASGEGMDSRPSVVSPHPVRVAARALLPSRGFRHTDRNRPISGDGAVPADRYGSWSQG